MKFDNFIERGFVKRTADKPTLSPIIVKVPLTQILDPDEAFRCVVKINFRRPDSTGRQKFCDLDVMPIFFALQIVLNQDQRLVWRATYP